ncbi:MAG: M50 family peptidase [Gemmatimonadales bacterium]|nr:MAG: M50 family peptidase [Gemmatimonadales bacterium]
MALTTVPLILLGHAVLDGPDAGAGRVSGLLFAVFFGLLASVAIHEMGHAVGGRLVGFRLVLLSVGPFQLRRTSAGLRFGLNDDWRLLAMEVSLPKDDGNLRRRLMFAFAAGPAANLLTLLLIVAAYWSFDLRQYSLEGVVGGDPVLPWYLTILAFQLGAFSLIGTVVNAVPLTDSGILSDGGRIRMLGRGGPEADRMMAALFLAGAVGGGVRPRDWRREWIDAATALQDGSPDEASACALAYYWALDRGEIDEAENYLRRAAAAASDVPILARSLAAEAAFFAARHRGDIDTARQNMMGVGDSWLERDTRLRAEAAILALEGRPAEAAERASEALSALQEAGSATAGIAVAEAEWIAHILSAAGAESNRPPGGAPPVKR